MCEPSPLWTQRDLSPPVKGTVPVASSRSPQGFDLCGKEHHELLKGRAISLHIPKRSKQSFTFHVCVIKGSICA